LAKTEASEAYVPLPKRLAIKLEHCRELTAWSQDRDFIFPNREGGFLDYETSRRECSIRSVKSSDSRTELPDSPANLYDQGDRRAQSNAERRAEAAPVYQAGALENYVKDIPESVYAMTDIMYEMISPSVAELLAQMPVKGNAQ
jgi:hypothetical protein